MRLVLGVVLALWGLPAFAEGKVLKDGFQACVADAVQAGNPVIACVADAQAQCAQYPEGEEAQLACYLSAKDEWGAQISELLSSFSDKDPKLQEVVRIEAKYAVLRNLMNCDLRMELSLVDRDPEPSDQIARAQCEALGTAASLVEVLFKSGTITR